MHTAAVFNIKLAFTFLRRFVDRLDRAAVEDAGDVSSGTDDEQDSFATPPQQSSDSGEFVRHPYRNRGTPQHIAYARMREGIFCGIFLRLRSHHTSIIQIAYVFPFVESIVLELDLKILLLLTQKLESIFCLHKFYFTAEKKNPLTAARTIHVVHADLHNNKSCTCVFFKDIKDKIQSKTTFSKVTLERRHFLCATCLSRPIAFNTFTNHLSCVVSRDVRHLVATIVSAV